MITHCPSCHTHFRVHAEQLAARAGQVRCGKCARVFDALEHLTEEIAAARVPRPSHGIDASCADAIEAEHAPEPAAAEREEAGGKSQEPVVAANADAQTVWPEREAEASHAIEAASTKPEPANAATGASAFDYNFGPTAASRSARPGHRWLWLTGTLLLLLVLLAQAVYQHRSALIVLFPETKPRAAALCAYLGCDLPPPRRIELMSIEASDLQANTINPSVMVLSATLKNRAIFNQQHPLLELTLTDAQDQPVVRRVLAPRDYLGKAVSAQDEFAANSEIAIKVFIEGSQVKATGYRLYLFYP